MADEDDDLQDASDDTGSDDSGADDSSDDSDDSGSGGMNPILQRYLQNKQQLASAQEKANTNELLTGLSRAGAYLTTGLARSNQPVDERPFNAMQAVDQAPVGNVLAFQKGQAADIANQKSLLDAEKQEEDQDPDSATSIAMREQVKRLYPGKYDEDTLNDMSAAEIRDALFKPLELDQKVKEHADEMKNKAADRASAAADRASQKQTHDQDAALQSTIAVLESARGNPAAAQAERDIYAAQKANTLYNNVNGNPNPEMAKLYISEIGKIAQGGTPTVDELKGLTPGVLTGPLASAWQALSGDPTPAGMQKFMAQYKQYADSVAKDAQQVIQDKYGRVIEANRGRLGEDNYNRLKAQYLDRFKNIVDQDSSNQELDPNHPVTRAQSILRNRQLQQQNQQAVQQIVPTPSYAAPAAPSGTPSLLVPPEGQAQNFAFGGAVKAPQPPGFAHIRQSYANPKLPSVKMPAPRAPKPPAMVMPAGMKPQTRPAGFSQGGTVGCYADGGEIRPGSPDPQKAREAMYGAENGEMNRIKYLLGLGPDPEKSNPPPAPPTQNYQQGGTVAGQPNFPHQNTPANDTVTAKLTPKEEVLPLSVTQSKSPALAAYLHMKARGYK